MSILSTVVFVAVAFATFVAYIKYKQRQHYQKLELYEQLWENFILARGNKQKIIDARKKLKDYICGVLETADSLDSLDQLYYQYTSYNRERPFTSLNFRWDFSSNKEVREAYEVVRSKLREIFKQKESRVEEERMKAALSASTYEEAQAVLVGNAQDNPSAVMALEKMSEFSLKEVLRAKTLPEFLMAKLRVPKDSLAERAVPYMFEVIVMGMVETAEGFNALSEAAERAPVGGPAFHKALQLMRRELQDKK